MPHKSNMRVIQCYKYTIPFHPHVFHCVHICMTCHGRYWGVLLLKEGGFYCHHCHKTVIQQVINFSYCHQTVTKPSRVLKFLQQVFSE